MTNEEYIGLKDKYTCKPYDWFALLEHIAFSEFDYAVEKYALNDSAEWEENCGRDIMDISVDQTEAIITNFIDRYGNYIEPMMVSEMRCAIQDETGLIC